MIDKQGKIFGKISIIDIIAVVLIVLAAIGVAMRFGGAETAVVSSSSKTITYTFKAENVRDYTVTALKKGGPVYDSTTKEYMGVIKDAVEVPAVMQIEMADGTYKTVEIPEKYDVTVTVECDGKVSDKGFYTADNKRIAPGSTYLATSKYAMSDIEIQEIIGESN